MRRLARDTDRLAAATGRIRRQAVARPPPSRAAARASGTRHSPAAPSPPWWRETCDTTIVLFTTQIKHRLGMPADDHTLKLEVTFCVRGVATPPCGVPRVAFFPPLCRRFPRSSVSSTGAFNHILIRCSILPSLTRRATLVSSADCGIVWLVGTGLGAVAFAEPRRSGPFRDRGLTEPAWRLVPVPPRRTRRADFPHRAPQVALTTTGDQTVARRNSGNGSSNQGRLRR